MAFGTGGDIDIGNVLKMVNAGGRFGRVCDDCFGEFEKIKENLSKVREMAFLGFWGDKGVPNAD